MRHCALHLHANHITRIEALPNHFWVSYGLCDHRSRELLKIPSDVFPDLNCSQRKRKRGGPAVLANEAATAGWSLAVHSRACVQDEPQTRIASALLIAPGEVRGQVLQVGTPFGRDKRADNSSVQPHSPAPEFSLLLLEERQQLLETLNPGALRLQRSLPDRSGLCHPTQWSATNRRTGFRVASFWIAIALLEHPMMFRT